jgi:hypothetical protein
VVKISWRDKQDEILASITGDADVHREYDLGKVDEDAVGYARSFLEDISVNYGGVDGFSRSDESVLYQHREGRHIWIAYDPGSVTVRGDELTADRFESILESDTPELAYVRNRAAEGKSRFSSAIRNFGGLFED